MKKLRKENFLCKDGLFSLRISSQNIGKYKVISEPADIYCIDKSTLYRILREFVNLIMKL
ncbi:hypothetical protein NRP93_002500 [Clostridium botulinum]|nr:hypothetical protein [Clostridium botulinum]